MALSEVDVEFRVSRKRNVALQLIAGQVSDSQHTHHAHLEYLEYVGDLEYLDHLDALTGAISPGELREKDLSSLLPCKT